MGMRVRASFEIPPNFSKETKTILQALETYGMMAADDGSNWYISGAADPHWRNSRRSASCRNARDRISKA
jgi:hypothetical protein